MMPPCSSGGTAYKGGPPDPPAEAAAGVSSQSRLVGGAECAAPSFRFAMGREAGAQVFMATGRRRLVPQ